MKNNIFNFFKTARNFYFEKVNQIFLQMIFLLQRTKLALSNTRGEAYLDVVVRLLISIILGALLLAGLYKLFDVVVMPRLESEIVNMFDYSG